MKGLSHGIDVMATRFQQIEGEMRKAKKVKADEVLEKFTLFMRKHMLRVSDLIERVDTSCDGVVDEEELAAAIKLVNMHLTDEEVKILFDFLDASGDGTIDAGELEHAMKSHRRIAYERDSLMSFMERTAYTKRNPIMTADKVSRRAIHETKKGKEPN